jgi:ADP-ribose pyrophosphatase
MNSIHQSSTYHILETAAGEVIVHEYQPESAVVLALQNQEIVVIRQYRRGVGEYTYELPGGSLENGEGASAAAKRELLEETGLRSDELHFLATVHSCGHLTNQIAHVFFAPDATPAAPQHLDADEEITVLRYSVADVLNKIAQGEWKKSELAHAVLLASLQGYLPTHKSTEEVLQQTKDYSPFPGVESGGSARMLTLVIPMGFRDPCAFSLTGVQPTYV